MIKTTINDDQLIIDIEGWDKLWSFKGRLNIEFSHIVYIREVNDNDSPPWLRVPGTHWPGVITAGTYYGKENTKEFWCTRHKKHGVLIELEHSDYSRIVIDIENNKKEFIEKIKKHQI